MGLLKSTLKKHINPIFIETGTCYGDTVDVAKRLGFNKIISIEVSKKLYKQACSRFLVSCNIQIINGDSSKILWFVIKNIREKITFVLDAHYLDWGADIRRDPLAREKYVEYPLLKELEIISRHIRKDHTIIIDDVRLFSSHFNTNIEEVREILLRINPKYKIEFAKGVVEDNKVIKDDVMIAYRKD